MRLDTIQQCPSLIGAELDFLEASEQFAALKHGASPPASRGNLRMETWELGVMDSKREVKRAHRKLRALQEHRAEVFADPAAWLPWTYQASLAPP